MKTRTEENSIEANYRRVETAQTPTWTHAQTSTRVEALCFGGVDLTAREANVGRHTDALRWEVVVRDDDGHEVVEELPGADRAEAIVAACEWMCEHPGGR